MIGVLRKFMDYVIATRKKKSNKKPGGRPGFPIGYSMFFFFFRCLSDVVRFFNGLLLMIGPISVAIYRRTDLLELKNYIVIVYGHGLVLIFFFFFLLYTSRTCIVHIA